MDVNTKKIIKQIIIVVLVAFLSVLGYYVYITAKNLSLINEHSKGEIPLDTSKPTNILILGTDRRTKNEAGRSDVMILVHLDPVNKKVTLLSIPRDSRVLVPGHGYDKINSSFNSDYFDDGGVDLSIKTVANLLGIDSKDIPYYVIVNFEGFAKVIDAIGGVTIDVKEPMHYHSWAGDVKIDLNPGVQHLDGVKALEYARFRYDQWGDFGVDEEGNVHGRVERQQELIKAIIDQTKDIRNIFKLPQIAQEIGNAVDTNLTVAQITKIGLTYKDLTSKDLQIVNFPGVSQMIDGISYVVPNYDKLKEIGATYFKLSNQ
ncbi:MAG: LCP family protein [Caldisericum sp.]|uniref:LCP family protein n=1 Tax=Caldisericum sp. TaxID=2499687 RepID=UPI003D142A7D